MKKIILIPLILVFALLPNHYTHAERMQKDEEFVQILGQILTEEAIYFMNEREAPSLNKQTIKDLYKKFYNQLGELEPPTNEKLADVHYLYYQAYKYRIQAYEEYERLLESFEDRFSNSSEYREKMEAYAYISEQYMKEARQGTFFIEYRNEESVYSIIDKMKSKGVQEYREQNYRKESTANPDQLQQPPIQISIDGTIHTYDQPPIIENGRTLVPLRGIFETLGAEVGWESATKTITVTKKGVNIELQLASTSPKVNGEIKPIEVPATAVNGRTLVPLRFVSEALGAEVDWDGETQTVLIDTFPISAKEYVWDLMPFLEEFNDFKQGVASEVEKLSEKELVEQLRQMNVLDKIDLLKDQHQKITPANQELSQLHGQLFTALENEYLAYNELLQYHDMNTPYWERLGVYHFQEFMEQSAASLESFFHSLEKIVEEYKIELQP